MKRNFRIYPIVAIVAVAVFFNANVVFKNDSDSGINLKQLVSIKNANAEDVNCH